MNDHFQKDLIVLVADKNMKFALSGLLSRNQSLEIRSIEYDIYDHPQHDPGCYLKGIEFLTSFQRSYSHALLIFDYDGSGAENQSIQDIQSNLEQNLNETEWGNRANVVIIDPELENWVWSDSPVVDQELGWVGKSPSLRTWLEDKGFINTGQFKPQKPKEAMEKALRETRKPRSSAIYESIAKQVSFQRCTDSAFLRLKEILQRWFGTNNPFNQN